MRFGTAMLEGGATAFRLWAPSAGRVELLLRPGEPGAVVAPPGQVADGWHEWIRPDAPAGTRYAYRIDGSLTVPDPASRFNPDDVHAPSEVVDPAGFEWQDAGWSGRPWAEAVVYELHVGTFTPAGSFRAIEARLDALARLGITAIELMPVADFPGARGWGYDGVLPFAPECRYGRPEDLKHLVQSAHQRGLMVLLDVVYNHFGPDGNYLGAYADRFFTSRHHTPWGEAINLDGPDAGTVRDFFLQNALYWLQEFHLDGLRIDAVHALRDDSATHWIDELAAAIEAGPGRERHVHLVLENHDNGARFLREAPGRARRLSVSQWNDDFHHALHVIVTGEQDGYYADFADQPVAMLGRSLAEGFAFQGEASPFHAGAARGEPSADLPPTAFVNFLQTHDQVGNRAFGERFAQLGPAEALRAAYAILLLAPAPPLLFMGEEFAAAQPFLYFCDFDGELAHSVTAGRRREFARFAAFADPRAREEIPDPNDPRTFRASRLRWSDRREGEHRRWLGFVRKLLQLRRREIVPRIPQLRPGAARYRVEARLLQVTWPLDGGGSLALQANLGASPVVATPLAGKALYATPPAGEPPREGGIAPWSVRMTLES
jgi:malto-oligosyltrehalose trehalohydrolase